MRITAVLKNSDSEQKLQITNSQSRRPVSSNVNKNRENNKIQNSMFDKNNDENEENIRRKKDKKLSKHFNIIINNQKYKIVKFLFKENKTVEREGKTIQLISKLDIQISERKNVKIKIEQDGKSYEIIGDWHLAWWGIGQNYVEYWINQIDEK